MKIDANAFKLREGDEVDLGLWATNVKPICKSKKAYRKRLEDQVDQLSDQQRLLYASNRHALLLVFQAMDTAGSECGRSSEQRRLRACSAARLRVLAQYRQEYRQAYRRGCHRGLIEPWYKNNQSKSVHLRVHMDG
nr:hypothetical protein [Rhodoferax sp.]